MSAVPSAPIAFFDVDETLIAAKGMLAFWDHWTADPAQAGAAGLGGSAVPDLRAAMAAGVPREELNRIYYRRFAGVPAAALRSAARRWYDGYRRSAEAFVTAGLDAVARHRALGHPVVLVSGSMRPLLEAVAEDLGADAVCCTEQEVAGGVLTGEVARPMIGRAKADAVTALIRARGVRAADCFAYGDHESDLAMLRAVGHPVVVNGSPGLVAQARRAGWPVLDGRRCPRGPVPCGPRAPHGPHGREGSAARPAAGLRPVCV
ncbi:HAD family hydrolase [Kitasatospora sp. NPDC056327]|uniref:HAD family hydrolase n=1 Tax=Kitasatospora sp. NPDC056327 TaxID=3345785 RepID=UPI0035DB434F